MPNSNILHGAYAPARTTDPETSHMAGDRVNVSRAQRIVLMAAKALHANGVEEFSDFDLVAVTEGISAQAVRTQRGNLVKKGLLTVADKEAVSPYGRRCMTHRLTEAGHAHNN